MPAEAVRKLRRFITYKDISVALVCSRDGARGARRSGYKAAAE
jgi:hypothetical protein